MTDRERERERVSTVCVKICRCNHQAIETERAERMREERCIRHSYDQQVESASHTITQTEGNICREGQQFQLKSILDLGLWFCEITRPSDSGFCTELELVLKSYH